MASPTYAEIIASLKATIYLLHLARDRAEVTSTTIATQIDTVQQGVEGDYVPELLDAVEAFRQKYAGALSSSTAQAMILPHLLHLAKLAGWPERDVSSLMGRFYDYCIANSYTVNSRETTFGAVAAGGTNVGTGTVLRLTKDENDYPIEANTVEVKTFECIGDGNSATSLGEESFEVRGAYQSKDGLDTLGSGLSGVVYAASGRHTQDLLDNPSFETYSGTAATPTAIQGWTINTIANVAVDTTGTANYYYRTLPEASTSYALKISGNVTVEQLFSTRQTKLSPSTPYYLQFAYNRETYSGDMTLTIDFGNTTKSVVLAAQAGWNVVNFTMDKKLWFKYFNKAGLSVKFTVSSYASGSVLIDDLILVPMTQIDGTWFTIVGGVTPFLRRDIFTFTDTGGTSAILNYWFSRATGHYLPAVTGAAETITDPP